MTPCVRAPDKEKKLETTDILVFAVMATAIYFIPLFVALTRHHQSAAAICVVNVFLGWTIIGWVAAFAWAMLEEPSGISKTVALVPDPPNGGRVPCPHCAEPILPAAHVCRFCQHELGAGWSEGAAIMKFPRQAHAG